MRLLESRRHRTPWIFDLRDQFAVWQGTRGPVPALLHPASFEVVAEQQGGTWLKIDPAIELQTVRNPSGFHSWHSLARRASGSRAKRTASWQSELLANGIPYALRVRTPKYSEFRIELSLPHDGPVVGEVAPGPDYPFGAVRPLRPTEPELEGRGPTLVRGSLRRIDGSYWAGARVEVVGGTDSSIPITDRTGAWVVAFRHGVTGSVSLRFTDEELGSFTVDGVRVVRGRATAHTQTGLRGRVLDPAGAPAVGARMTVTTTASFESSTGPDGSWALSFPPDVHTDAPAQASIEVRWQGAELQRATVVPPREVLTEDFRFL